MTVSSVRFSVLSFVLFALLFGCAAKEKEESFELKLTKISSSDYLKIELKGDVLYSESLPSPVVAMAPRPDVKNISSDLNELKSYIKKSRFLSWKNETDQDFEVTTIDITIGDKHNIVVAEIGKESPEFKVLADKIIALASPKYT